MSLTLTAAQVLKSANGNQAIGVIAAATTVVAGNTLYQLANGTYGLADADGVSPINSFAGIALTGGGAGQPVLFCSRDTTLTLGAGAAMTVGGAVWLDDVAGGLTQTYADLDSADTVVQLGIALTASTIDLNPCTAVAKP